MPITTDLAGRTVLLAGAHTSLGAEVARQLVPRGATVVLAGPRFEPVAGLMAELAADWPHADLYFERLELGDLHEVRTCAQRVVARYDRLTAAILCPRVRLEQPVASQLVPLQRGIYALVRSILGHRRLDRIVLATSLERPRGTSPERRWLRDAAERCGRATGLLAQVLASGDAPVVACRPSEALPRDLRSRGAGREAEVVLMAMYAAYRLGRVWTIPRWGRLPRATRSFADPTAAANLGAWLASETGILGLTPATVD